MHSVFGTFNSESFGIIGYVFKFLTINVNNRCEQSAMAKFGKLFRRYMGSILFVGSLRKIKCTVRILRFYLVKDQLGPVSMTSVNTSDLYDVSAARLVEIEFWAG